MAVIELNKPKFPNPIRHLSLIDIFKSRYSLFFEFSFSPVVDFRVAALKSEMEHSLTNFGKQSAL